MSTANMPDAIFAVMIFACAIFLHSVLPESTAFNIGLPSWLFPMSGLVIMGGGGITLLVLSIMPNSKAQLSRKKVFFDVAAVAPPILLTVTATMLWALVGLVWSLPPMLACMMLWMGERSITRILGVAALLPLTVGSFAHFILATPLP